MRAAMSLSRTAALRQSQSAHNSRVNRVRFQSGCAWRSPRIYSISEGLSSLPCMTLTLAMDAKYDLSQSEFSGKCELFQKKWLRGAT